MARDDAADESADEAGSPSVSVVMSVPAAKVHRGRTAVVESAVVGARQTGSGAEHGCACGEYCEFLHGCSFLRWCGCRVRGPGSALLTEKFAAFFGPL